MRIKIFWNILLYCLASSNHLQDVGIHLPEEDAVSSLETSVPICLLTR